ncbi:MAG: UDP-N-acetylmuramoyl-L-alanine--D-glutamate ligase [Ruminococcaceae bacterium]|nr:UDP-N-acetylmuramoyl-L-alanine--D-glutamate ligase [Oscillospiraceae bacterium]
MFFFDGRFIKTVGFLGLGKSNIGVLEYLRKHYSNLNYILRCESGYRKTDFVFGKIFLGQNALDCIEEDILFLSPSVRRDRPELIRAEARGVVLTSDAEFFFSFTDADVYAVTGSDGKSTTTYLSSQLLKRKYKQVIASGNIGEAMTPHLDDPGGTAHAAELSSFQLSYMKPKVKRAVITNITENHLNWHKSFDEYISAKRNLFYNAEERIINFDCKTTRIAAGDFDIFAVFSKNSCEKAMRDEIRAKHYISLSNGFITVSGEPMLDARKIKLKGEHNILNFMAATAMSLGIAKKENIAELAESFGGLRHRRELVLESDGVGYFDSSIDSSPKRCAATLESFSERVILILGGRSKGLDFGELLPTLARKTKYILLTGECRGEIKRLLERDCRFGDGKIPFHETEDFDGAIRHAHKIAKSGDSVLLSPAATSYDLFSSFEERGNRFKKTITDITNE